MKLHWLFNRYMAPAGDEGGGGGAADRGDDFVPTDDESVGTAEPKAGEKDAGEAAAKGDEKTDDKSKDDEKADDKPKGDDKPKDDRIPTARHKEILERERARREAVERELARYQQGDKVAETNQRLTEAETKLEKLEADYAKALTDGETDKATKLMREIRQTERGIVESKSQAELQAAEARAYERARYSITLERLEAAYPEINPDHDDFDKEKLAEVAELKSAYQLKGYTPAEALQKAIKLLLKPQTAKQETAVETKARVSEDEVKKELGKDRATAAREKNADAAAKQPPALTKIGTDSDKAGGAKISGKDVMKMTQDQFAKLDEKTLAELRGDELV